MLSIGRMPIKRNAAKWNRACEHSRSKKVLGHISRRHERNSADRRDIVCVIFMRNDVNTYKLWYYENVNKWEVLEVKV